MGSETASKELKTFIHTGEVPEAVVVTIPASFDMAQSNATSEAAYAAGFKQVVLLQEPIAASLAYANTAKDADLRNSQWIVYDLGGGTFDVALVKIVEGELKVVDHEGDNYLGGTDFDAMIVEKLVVPQIERMGEFDDLLPQMKSESGRYNRLWYVLQERAEAAKIELSSRTCAEIDLDSINIEDDNGKAIDGYVPITRSEYEDLIKGKIDNTADMLRKILTRNSLRPQDLAFVLMVGGSTYTPFVRKRVEELLGIPVNTGINPTNAIVIGAAYFAATREVRLESKKVEKPAPSDSVRVKLSYSRASQEQDEMLGARVEGGVAGLFYRITRDDGGYDSGLRVLTPRIMEDLPLRSDAYNLFSFKIYDGHNNLVYAHADPIQIAQGKYSAPGQMLPEDVSLVLDDLDNRDTRNELIFARNIILPARCKKTREASKTLCHGTDDEIRIIVVEGPTQNHPSANKTVGHLVIPAKHLKRDVIRGSDIDLVFEMSESRELKVRAYVTAVDQEYGDVFTPKARNIPVRTVQEEIGVLGARVEEEKAQAISNENFEIARELDRLSAPLREIHAAAMLLDDDDVTNDCEKIESKKREIARTLHEVTAGKRIGRLRQEYQVTKDEVKELVDESGNDHERRQLHEVVVQEHTFLNSSNPQKIEDAVDALKTIRFGILRRSPEFLERWFRFLLSKRETLNDQLQARHLIEAGKKHLGTEDYDSLAEVNWRLHCLLPEIEKDSDETRHFTGIR